jgi:hypothetical protein
LKAVRKVGVVRESPASKDVNTEVEGAVENSYQKTISEVQQTEKT